VGKVLVEIIASSPDDCVLVERAGADRIELCSALVLGGLTPSIGVIKESKARVSIPIMVMIRPRASGMAYSEAEFASMVHDVDAAVEAEADGLVFGCLLEDGRLDVERMKLLARRCGKRQMVCHRAFDVTPDPFEALEALIDLGITRVLTSGQKPTAPEGVDVIKALIDRADGRIEVLPGAGLNAENVADFVERTACDQVHLAAFRLEHDSSGDRNPAVQFSGSEPPPEGSYDVVDSDTIRGIVRLVGRR
jgi:copper homeostasis protein